MRYRGANGMLKTFTSCPRRADGPTWAICSAPSAPVHHLTFAAELHRGDIWIVSRPLVAVSSSCPSDNG
jgi:hypothetical protein